jgi:hypothetical protein
MSYATSICVVVALALMNARYNRKSPALTEHIELFAGGKLSTKKPSEIIT